MLTESYEESAHSKHETATPTQRREGQHASTLSLENEECYRFLVESVQDYAIFLLDLDGQIASWNIGAEYMTGYQGDDIIGQPFAVFYPHEKIRGTSPAQELQIVTDEGRLKEEGWRLRQDGSLFLASLVITALRDRSGDMCGFSVVMRDITDERAREDALRQSEARFRRLADANIIGVAIGDLAGVMTEANDIFLHLIGYSREELQAGYVRWDKLTPPEYHALDERAQLQLKEAAVTIPWEKEFIRRDGSRVPVLVGATLLEGSSDQCIAFILDLTPQVQLFEQVNAGRAQLQILSRRLIEAQEAERRHIAHELHDEIGQALTAVKINLQAAQHLFAASPPVLGSAPVEMDANPPPLLPHLEESIEIVEKALQQVRNLSLDLRPSLLDDLGLVAALRWYTDRQAQRSGLQAKFTVAPTLSELCEERLSAPMKTACFRIAQEALTNVLRHAQAHQVEIELTQQGDELRLAIRDDGIGFNVQEARQRAAQGTSLGLLGMEERVSLVGGHFSLNSAPGRGSEVLVRLPLAENEFSDRRHLSRNGQTASPLKPSSNS